MAMSVSKSVESVTRGKGARLLSLGIVLGACVWMSGLLAVVGSYLHERDTGAELRFCKGRCICDGGSTDPLLMDRVCPDGWERAYKHARAKRRKELRRRRLEKQRRAAEEPPPESLVPSV